MDLLIRYENINKSAYRFAQTLFLLGVFVKQFYLLPSGGFQLGDLCFMISFLVLLFFVLRFKIPLSNGDELFFIFVGCVTLINLFYIFIYGNNYPGEFRFHKSILYYVFNLIIVITFRQFSLDKGFLKKLRIVLQTGLLFQLVVSIGGFGRFDSIRYMGTFNDPNQCGFFVLSSFLIIFIISRITNEGHSFIWYAISFYLILKTVSTGMLLGMIIFLIVYIYQKISAFNRKTGLAFIILAFLLLILFALYSAGVLTLPQSFENSAMYKRVLKKLLSFGVGSDVLRSVGINNLFVDRCWDRIIDYPLKLLYGAGEGYFNRFPSARYINNEIHSSILGPLFYYGFIPCSIWFIWTAKQLKGIKLELWAAYIALIVESVTLVNNRQPFFWMIFVLAGSYLAKNTYQIDNCIEENTSVEDDEYEIED